MPELTSCPSMPIGMFDSGVGGLTIMQEIVNALPHESIIYYGDTARLPYGEKSAEEIVQFSSDNASFLVQKGIKILVIACSTASVHAAAHLRQQFTLPIIDVVESGVQQVVLQTKTKRIGILATRSTVASGLYEREITKHLPEAFVISIACPLFVPLIEECFVDHPATKLIIREYLQPLRETQIDTLLLGCTHFPLLAPLIQEELPNVMLIDPAKSCALSIFALLNEEKLASAPKQAPSHHQIFVSEDSFKFSKFAARFFNLRSYNVVED